MREKDIKGIITTAFLVGDLETTREYMKVLAVSRTSVIADENWTKEDIENVLKIMHGDEFISSLMLVCKGFNDDRIYQALKTALADSDFLNTYRDKVQYYIDQNVWIDSLVKVWIAENDKLGIPSDGQEKYLSDLIHQILGGCKEE
jgi:hypothetical protein